MFNNNFAKYVLELNKQCKIDDATISSIKHNKNTTLHLLLKIENVTLDEFLKKESNWDFINSYKYLNIDFISKHYDKFGDFYCWDTISKNNAITIQDIENNPDIPWEWDYICKNKNITIDFIKKHINKDLSWYNITRNTSITLQDVENNLDLPWDWSVMPHCSPKILNYIESIMTLNFINNFVKCNYYYCNVNIIMFVLEFFNKKSNNAFIQSVYSKYTKKLIKRMRGLSSNNGLTIDIIKKYPEVKWNWYYITSNTNIKIQDIENNPDLPWEANTIIENPNLTIDFIKNINNHYINPNWSLITLNPIITMNDIENNLDLPWDWDNILCNPNVTIDFIKKYKHKITMNDIEFAYLDEYFLTPSVVESKKKIYMELLFKDLQLWIINKNKLIFKLCMHEFKLKIDDFKIRGIKKNNYQDNWI